LLLLSSFLPLFAHAEPCDKQSPFPPDATNDSTFVTCSSPIHVNFGFGTPMNIDIPVSRVVGDVQAMTLAGFLGPQATIKIPAIHCPYNDDFGVGEAHLPMDEVKINGHPIGFLQPGNAVLNVSPGLCTGWSLTSLQVPLQYLNFPTNTDPNSPPVPAINRIEIDVDTLHQTPEFVGWDTQVDWAEISFIVPRPILLVHGILSSSATWFPLWYNQLTLAKVPFYAVSLPGGIPGHGGTLSIETNAQVIGDTIQLMKRQFGVDMVNIAAHSKGGIDSKHYIETHHDVERIVQIGTPNGGSPLADYLYEITKHIPFLQKLINKIAPIEVILTTHNMKNYAAMHGRNADVHYSAIAGVWHPGWLDFSLWHLATILVGKGDAVVPRWSVYYESPFLQSYTTKFEFDSYGSNKDAIHTHLTSSQFIYAMASGLLGVKPPVFTPTLPHIGPFEDPGEELPTASRTKTFGGTLHKNEQTVQTVVIDESKPVSFSMVFPSTDVVSLQVIAPSGAVWNATSTYPDGSGYELEDCAGQPMASIHFDHPEIGTWRVQVSADAIDVNPDSGLDSVTPSASNASLIASASSTKPAIVKSDVEPVTNYLLSIWMENPSKQLAVALDRESVHIGDNFRVKATLTQDGTPLLGVPVAGEVAQPDGTLVPLTLHDDGLNGDQTPNDGVYTADFPAALPGDYNVRINAEETRPGASPFSREASVSGSAAISHTHVQAPFSDAAFSSSGSGLYTTLSVSGYLNMDAAGHYSILGTLTDGQGGIVATAPLTIDTSFPGVTPVNFAFQGAAINASQKNGPYHLDVRVMETKDAMAFTQDDHDLYTTGLYSYFQFQGPAEGARTPTVMSVNQVIAPYGGAADVSATLTAYGLPLAGRTVRFTAVGSFLGTATTDQNGVATMHNAPVPGFNPAGSYLSSASYDGDQAYMASSGSGTYFVTEGAQTITWANPADIAPGTPLGPDQLNAVVRGSGITPAGDLTYDPPAGTILSFGDNQTLTVTAADNGFYGAAVASVKINVRNPSATVTWSNPADITYGTALNAAQLNATASMPGTFSYSPAAGTVLNAGANQTLTVTFVPSNGAFPPVTKSVSINVLKAAQTIQWAKPAAIVYGTPLTAAQLNATTNGGAPLTYTPAAGTVLNAGTQTLTVTAAATPNYNAATASVTIDVAKATPAITWSNPADIVYGTALSSTQLNATVDSGAALSYTPAAGTVLGAGSRTLTVTAAETANYGTATKSVVINVVKATPVVTWSTPASIVYGTPLSSTQLDATANVPGTFVYTPAAGTILNAGAGQSLSVQFTPADTANEQAATATVIIDVAKAKQTITWSAPAPIVYGTALSATQLNAATNTGATLTYTPSAGTILNAGNGQTLTVTAAATPNYDAATATVSIDVLKAKPLLTWAAPAPIVYGTPLDATQLNATANVAGTFNYTPSAGALLDAGSQTLSAHFTPADTRDYDEADASVTLVVQRATPVITWAKPSPIVYGTALDATQLSATANVAGTFSYTPAAGTILNAGSAQTLSVHFTATDTRNYNDASATTTIDVAKAHQTLSWTPPAAIVYGTPLSSAQLNASVSVAGPAPAGTLTYAPASGSVLDAGSRTLTVTALETANYLPATLSVSLDVNRAPLSLNIDPKSKLYGAAVPLLTGTLTGVVNNDNITPSYATTATQQSGAGTYPINGALVDPNHRLSNYAVTITPSTLTVFPAPLLIAANPATSQYSDPLPQLTATFTGFVLGETPSVLAGTLSITTTGTQVSAPGTYPIAIGGLTSSNYAIAYSGSTLTITQEDARVTITSPLSITLAASGDTTVRLAATVKDISATANADGDIWPGNIVNATLTFVDRATDATLCTATINLVAATQSAPTDSRIGAGTCTFTRAFPASTSTSLRIGAKIGGYYIRDVETDDATMTIAPPTSDSITGSGTAGGDKFSINLQYDKSGAVKGSFRYSFESLVNGVTYKYQLDAASIDSLSIHRTATGGAAAIVGTAVLRDVTTPSSPIVVDAAAPLIVTATDNGEPSTNDGISVTLFNKKGGFYIATGWNSTRAVEEPVTDGNLVIHLEK
jgi:triacylglycerol esterase/lipase EstA (alpha/beta hydrolase family)